MRTARISAYWLSRLKRLPVELVHLNLPLNICRRAFYAIAILVWPCGVFKGIRILDFSRATRSRFNEKICEALTVIEHSDSRRFARVQREVRLIVYDRWLIEPLTDSSYFNQARVCMVNLGRFDFKDFPRFRTSVLAAVILHHATQGHLRRVRFMNVNRCEAICRKEEIHFLMKLGYDLRGFDTFKDNKTDPRYIQYCKEFFDKLSRTPM